LLGSDIYVVGGIEEDTTLTAAIHRYSTMTNVWTTLTPVPDAKMGHSVCALSGLIYVLGGQMSIQENDMVIMSSDSVHKSDLTENLWTTAAPMSRAGLTIFVLGGSMHAGGGFSGVDDLSSVEKYSAASDSWETVPGMELSGPRVDFGTQVMTLEVGLFHSLKTKARRARN
jgi:hypothetical protein